MKNKILLTILLIFVIVCGYFAWTLDQNFNSIPEESPVGEYSFEVEKGESIGNIAVNLENENIITSKDAFLIRTKLERVESLQVGTYTLNLPANQENILDSINKQSIQKYKEIQELANKPYARVTLKEGKTLDDMIKALDEKGVVSSTKMVEYAQNPANFDRETFEFLPEPLNCEYGNLTNCAKYYPEGYLYPDTYNFFLESTPKQVFDKLLNNFNSKVWNKVEDQVNQKEFHKMMILASVLEKETGRAKAVDESGLKELNEERKMVAGVFYNRIDLGMKLQSNPTVEYGTGAKLCEQTFERDGCKFLNDPVFATEYNTYLNSGYPIGPITNPQYYNIEAVINPIENDYYFFIADLTGKTYFSSTGTEHEQMIEKVKEINQGLN